MGAVLQPGDPLLWVDERPVIVVPGAVPMYRDLIAPPGDALVGADVEQLQAFLAAAGYLGGPIDGRFGTLTGEAAGEWRDDHSMSDLRGFTQAELVFVAGGGPWTVTEPAVSTGAVFAGGEVLEVSSGVPAVTVSLDGPPPADASYAVVALPGRDASEIPLAVSGPATASEDGGYLQLLAVESLPEGTTLSVGTAVVVEQRQTLAANVVTVPVAAIRLDAAGRSVVICRDSASAEDGQCPVALGVSNDTLVEVVSGVDAGTEVAVAP